ncbi:transglycosylase SLT domain-containing protein [Acidithiobacillus sp. M4-SHS-6]|uniref:transglycosylase SLT domain-containing protein n=1 Tax=Acidithiobacillus sp. M4-SHS-6 TaxID=3383024 RepID=UPI0039BE6748
MHIKAFGVFPILFAGLLAVHPASGGHLPSASRIPARHSSFRILWGAGHARMLKNIENAGMWHAARKLAGPYAAQAIEQAELQHLPKLLIAAIIHQENGGDLYHCAEVVSPAGAIGPMQLMPDTAWQFLRINPWNPRQNIQGGARYVKYLVEEFHSVRKALMAYNAGPTAVARGYVPQSSVFYARAIMKSAGLVVI